MDPHLIGNADERSQEIINSEIKAKKEEKERARLANKKRRKKMRGKEFAGKDKLVKEGRKELIKREMIRRNNIYRVKVRLAEKVKMKKEMDELVTRTGDLSAIHNDILSNNIN